MVQQSSSPHDFSVDLDHDVALLPTQPAAYVPPTFPAQPAGHVIAAPKVGSEHRQGSEDASYVRL